MIYRFDNFQLDTHKRLLTHQNSTVPISSKAYEILLYLIENAGNVVSKDELLNKIWKDSFVEEANLAVHISALRKIFNQFDDKTEFIKTISGQGYCFVSALEKSVFLDSTKPFSNHKTDIEVIKLYKRGKAILESRINTKDTKETLLKSLDFFQKAVSLDTNFALAYVGIGLVYVAFHNHSLIDKEKSLKESNKALQLAINTNENISEIYILKGAIDFTIKIDIYSALESFQKAAELNPKNPDAYHWQGLSYAVLCDFEKAIEFATKAVELDPTNFRRSGQLTRYYFWAKDFNKSIVHAEEVLAFNPNDSGMYVFLSSNYVELNLFDLAIQNIDKAIEIKPTSEFLLMKAYYFRRFRKNDEALSLIDEIMQKYPRHEISNTLLALVYDSFGEIEKAFELLFKDLAENSGDLCSLKFDHRFINIRKDKRFDEILKHLNIF